MLKVDTTLKSNIMKHAYEILQNKLVTADTLTVLTINIQAYITCDANKSCNEMLKIITGSNADVICLQEDLEKRMKDTLGSYHLIVTCRGEQKGDTHLMNNIYIHQSKINQVQYVTATDITCGCKTPRCSSIIRINNLTIANIHLCGGRYDDTSYDKLIDVKKHEVTKLVNQSKPDLIVGDFNAEATLVDGLKTLSHYELYNNLPLEDKKKFIDYYISHHLILSDKGYLPAYTVGQVGVTSVYGGTPDWMYYQPTKLRVIECNTINMAKYTDHNAVLVTFSIA